MIQADLEAALPEFLLAQRWYPAKDAGRPRAALVSSIPWHLGATLASIAIWRVTAPSREPMLLFVPIALVPLAEAESTQLIAKLAEHSTGAPTHALVDAFSRDDFVRSWVSIQLQPDDHPASLRMSRTRQGAALSAQLAANTGIRRMGAEQSNTSLRIGELAILKVFRKLEEGVHPELEVGRFLTERGFAATPALLGWVETAGSAGSLGCCTLSVLQAWVPNQGDGWTWMLQRLERVGRPDGLQARQEVAAWLQALARRTAEMHRTFAAEEDDPAFRPEPVNPQDVAAWSEAAHAMARRALDGLAAAQNLDPLARRLAQQLQAQLSTVSEKIEAIRAGSPALLKTRHHGDFHLGQVLVSGADAILLDFEGEPLRPLAQRRAKHSPLRDVAGMLRSFSYATEAAFRALSQSSSEPRAPEDMNQARTALEGWRSEADRLFVESYFEAAHGVPGIPLERSQADRVLGFLLLEKALYEVAYELANRPDWVAIALQGVLELLRGAEGVRRRHSMPFGAELLPGGPVRFRLWAPSHSAIQLEIDGGAELLPMQPAAGGWFELITDRARAGSRYGFVLPDGLRAPDPASRFQPEDVHGPSEVIDPEGYVWRDDSWRGRPWEETVLYELHVGAFTPEGTFRATIDKLDHLAALGVTAIEIMPVSDFPGQRNWGYDGVAPYAPDSSYGRPQDLKALIEAAHERGVMVLLDVVYNHFGPEGAYLHTLAPCTFTERHKTPWGAAINTDGPDSGPVREFFIQNALYWIEEFHLDGLRLDAVHAILDDSPKHLLEELAERLRTSAPDRWIHLILENEENEARWLVRAADGKPRWYTAQWNDDVHHVLHVAATGESQGYYADYRHDTDKLGRALAEGFAFQGETMPYRGRPRGDASAALPTSAFVAFIQNHDQVGNRAFGERLTSIAPAAAVRAVAAVYLLLPQIPMLFMGEEWGARQPFPFFCDFGPELAAAVRKGRREEFARFPEFHDPANRERIPDPMALETFASAKLVWADVRREPHASWYDWYRRLLTVRRGELIPRLSQARAGTYEVIGPNAVIVRWPLEGETWVLEANLSPRAMSGFRTEPGRVLWLEGRCEPEGSFGPYTVRWSIESARPKPDAGEPSQTSSDQSNTMLDRLAERMGIQPDFRNAHGLIVRTSAQTQRRLLSAMGLTVRDEKSVEAELEALERVRWSRGVGPVEVVKASSAPVAVEAVFPPDVGELRWTLALESGEVRSGGVAFRDLELVSERELDGGRVERRRLVLGRDLPWGYHELQVEPGGTRMRLIVTPERCWVPRAFEEGRRLWGIAAQLYLLRSARNWGIGDFRDLRELVMLSAAHGADVIGLNPLHAMFIDNPEHASPYSPASRLLLNVLNIDVEAVPELSSSQTARDLLESSEFQRALAGCRDQSLVDYASVADLKLRVLRLLFEACRDDEDRERWREFCVFRDQRGALLEQSCRFLALREHFSARNPTRADWHTWPEEYRDPRSDAVQRFAAEHRDEVAFLAWLQWIADDQLCSAARTAANQHMRIGLYRDLAVGADRAGAETWVNARAVISGVHVGAPPDVFNPAGQDWGLPPFNPHRLRSEAYRSFIDLVRANMRHAGGLRIDHVMGLQQLYWVPAGAKPSEGAYVRYPLEDLVGILALESHRQHCLVVGEDLGTVPENFRDRMGQASILSYRVLFFEQDPATGAFIQPGEYPRLALAVSGSHDLPTLRGWWEGRDIELKEQLGLFPQPQEAQRQRETRRRDRAALVEALRQEGLLAQGAEPDIHTFARAAHGFLARTNSMLAMAQLDDLTDEADPVNVPATSDEHPNWRRRMSLTIEELRASRRFLDITSIFATERRTRRSPGERPPPQAGR